MIIEILEACILININKGTTLTRFYLVFLFSLQWGFVVNFQLLSWEFLIQIK